MQIGIDSSPPRSMRPVSPSVQPSDCPSCSNASSAPTRSAWVCRRAILRNDRARAAPRGCFYRAERRWLDRHLLRHGPRGDEHYNAGAAALDTGRSNTEPVPRLARLLCDVTVPDLRGPQVAVVASVVRLDVRRDGSETSPVEFDTTRCKTSRNAH